MRCTLELTIFTSQHLVWVSFPLSWLESQKKKHIFFLLEPKSYSNLPFFNQLKVFHRTRSAMNMKKHKKTIELVKSHWNKTTLHNRWYLGWEKLKFFQREKIGFYHRLKRSINVIIVCLHYIFEFSGNMLPTLKRSINVITVATSCVPKKKYQV